MKTVLVIGASNGIGKATSEKLLALDNQVLGTYCTNNHVIEGVESQFLDVTGDVSNLQIPEKLDGLVFCPGSINLKPFRRVSDKDMIEDYQLQVVGAVKVIQHALNALKKGKGSIVLFSTIAVQQGFSFHSIVSASKGAIEGLVKSIAAELSPTIRVNAIAPSITNTPLASGLLSSDEKIKVQDDRHPLKRVGQPEDIASAVVYLLSNESSWMTGQILHVDGGLSSIK